MATHGSVGTFEPGTVDWSTYVEQLQYYFSANGVESADKKRSILLANCGPATFKLIRSLIAPCCKYRYNFLQRSGEAGAGILRAQAVCYCTAIQVQHQIQKPWRNDRHLRCCPPRTRRTLLIRRFALRDASGSPCLRRSARRHPKETPLRKRPNLRQGLHSRPGYRGC